MSTPAVKMYRYRGGAFATLERCRGAKSGVHQRTQYDVAAHTFLLYLELRITSFNYAWMPRDGYYDDGNDSVNKNVLTQMIILSQHVTFY